MVSLCITTALALKWVRGAVSRLVPKERFGQELARRRRSPLLSALLARPVLLNGCPRSLSRLSPAESSNRQGHVPSSTVFVPEERLELSRGCPRTILSRVRIPFRHSGLWAIIVRIPSICKCGTTLSFCVCLGRRLKRHNTSFLT